MNIAKDNQQRTNVQDMPASGTFRLDFNGTSVGYIDVNQQDGYTWRVLDPDLAAIMPKSRFSPLPATVHNLHPNLGMFGDLLGINTKQDFIGTGIKMLSGLRMAPIDPETGEVPERGRRLDFKQWTLADTGNVDEHDCFTGIYAGPQAIAGTKDFERLITSQWVNRINHRFSGKQTKMPCFLAEGLLTPSIDRLSFSHFVKYPALGGREADGLLEWAGLRMARDIGEPVADFALLDQGEEAPPALIVERFDIPKNQDELKKDWILLQDFYSILGQDPKNEAEHKGPGLFTYTDLLEGWIEYTKKHDPKNTDKNTRAFLKRMLTSWAGNDADLHAKNLSALLHIDSESKKITHVELSPAYDICPSTLCGTDGEPMFYNLARKKGQAFDSKPSRTLNMNDFLSFLSDPRLSVDNKPYCVFESKDEAQDFIRDIASGVAHSLVNSLVNVPPCVRDHKQGPMLIADLQLLAAISIKRAASIGADVPKIEFAKGFAKSIKKGGAKARRDAFEKKGLSDLYNNAIRHSLAQGQKLMAETKLPIPAHKKTQQMP